jgi:RNA-directed DNA polymerase
MSGNKSKTKSAKKARDLYPQVCDFSSLYKAAYQARKNVKLNRQIATFFFHLDEHIHALQEELHNKTYVPRPYRSFVIHEPKPRLIQAAHFRDRVVHHSLCAVLEPILLRSMMADSYACQKGKGMHQALKRAHACIKKYAYCVKIDIHHFFENLHHDVLLERLRKRIDDADVFWLIENILQHGASSHCAHRGVPIGNLTSQHFGNFYLDALDHYIVHHTPARAMVRYMDDVLMCTENKRDATDSLGLVDEYVEDTLLLTLKHSATRVAQTNHGVSFLGFRLLPTHIRMDRTRLRRFRTLFAQRLDEQATDDAPSPSSLEALCSFADCGDTVQLRNKMIQHRQARQT